MDYLNSLYDADCNVYDTDKLLEDYANGVEEAKAIVGDTCFWLDMDIDFSAMQEDEIDEILSGEFTDEEIARLKARDYESYIHLGCELYFNDHKSDCYL